MGEYNQNQSLLGDWILDDVCNAIALRKDIHNAFDDGKFAIVPKEPNWVVQFMGHTNGLGNDSHNTHIELKGVSSQFLYARFAWTIFPNLESFPRLVNPERCCPGYRRWCTSRSDEILYCRRVASCHSI
jgi:hypothetical protein